MTDVLKETRNLIRKKSSLRRLSKEIGIERSSLHISLKEGSNATLKTLTKVLDHLGYELRISKKRQGKRR
jgi:DNA-binding phage protein